MYIDVYLPRLRRRCLFLLTNTRRVGDDASPYTRRRNDMECVLSRQNEPDCRNSADPPHDPAMPILSATYFRPTRVTFGRSVAPTTKITHTHRHTHTHARIVETVTRELRNARRNGRAFLEGPLVATIFDPITLRAISVRGLNGACGISQHKYHCKLSSTSCGSAFLREFFRPARQQCVL